jgi:hypothetical protein
VAVNTPRRATTDSLSSLAHKSRAGHELFNAFAAARVPGPSPATAGTLRRAINGLQITAADYPFEKQVEDMLQAGLSKVAPDTLVRLRTNILAHLDETCLCPAQDAPLDIEHSLLAAMFRKADGELAYRRIAEPLMRLIDRLSRGDDIEAVRYKLYEFSDWLAVVLDSGADWTEPITCALRAAPDFHIRRLAQVLSHLPGVDGETPYQRLCGLFSPRPNVPRQTERDARIPALLCRAVVGCILDRLDHELRACAIALREAAHCEQEARAALQRLERRLDGSSRFGAHHLLPLALLQPYCDGLCAKSIVLAGPAAFDRYRSLVHDSAIAQVLHSIGYQETAVVRANRADALSAEPQLEHVEPLSEARSESQSDRMHDSIAQSRSRPPASPGSDTTSRNTLTGGAHTTARRLPCAPGPRQGATLRAELCRIPGVQPLLPVEVRDVAGAVRVLSLGRQFRVDAIDRPSVSFTVSGVSANGSHVHCGFPAEFAGSPRTAALRAGVGALYQLAREHTELLTRIMTQQTSGALCAGLQQLGAESPIRTPDGVAFIPGGSASLHFDVVRRPDGCFRIDAAILFARLESGTRVYADGVESAQFDPSRSYFRATFGLLLSPTPPRLDMVESVGFDYALVPSDQTHVLGVRV